MLSFRGELREVNDRRQLAEVCAECKYLQPILAVFTACDTQEHATLLRLLPRFECQEPRFGCCLSLSFCLSIVVCPEFCVYLKDAVEVV